MNCCFIIGNVLNEPVFKFFYMKKHTSICCFSVNLNECKGNHINVFALDNTADYVFQKIHKGQKILIDGSLYSKKSHIYVKINTIKVL